MLFPTQHLIFVPVAVLVATTVLGMIVAAYTELQAQRRAAKLAAQTFRPVLVHDRARGKLLRSARQGMNRPAADRVRLVYNGG